MDKKNLTWQIYLGLEEEVINLSKYVLFSDTTTKYDFHRKRVHTVDNPHLLETYSPHIADLLVRCCVEIEALAKELYTANGGSKQTDSKDTFFDTDCLDYLNNQWQIGEKVVYVSNPYFNFEKDENRVLIPLHNAEKRSKTYWTKAYQAVKHNRYNSLYMGNIKALLQAMGALYLLNIYHRDISLNSKYFEYNNLDMSFGSKIFSIALPHEDYLINVINGTVYTEILKGKKSPYIIKFSDNSYKKIHESKNSSFQKIREYLISQKELNEPDFLLQLQKRNEEVSKNPRDRLIMFWELGKYRINKKIPKDLPFEQRKALFISTPEWKGKIRMANNHLKENELTEENIQSEIDRAGTLAGMELETRFENIWMPFAFQEGYCDIVLDKNNVRYPELK